MRNEYYQLSDHIIVNTIGGGTPAIYLDIEFLRGVEAAEFRNFGKPFLSSAKDSRVYAKGGLGPENYRNSVSE